MYALMHEKLKKYAQKNLYQLLKLSLYYFKTNRSIFKFILCDHWMIHLQ
jgi:hypothetical protein